MKCTLCPELVKSRRKICEGEIFSTRPAPDCTIQVMAVAEAPGIEEDKRGRPLIGTSGQEARHHLTINGITSRGVILDNICMCHPKDNRDPNATEIANCANAHLIPSIIANEPTWIIAMGRIATRFFLGDVDVEMVHGIPHSVLCPVSIERRIEIVVIPTYHPAAGLHTPEKMILFQADMRVAGGVIKGKISPHPPVDGFEGKEQYELINTSQQCTNALAHNSI